MGTLLAQDLIARCGTALGDTNNAQWSVTELLGYLNDAQRTIATQSPIAGQEIAVVPLVQGARQTLPANGCLLMDILRNMGPSGSTPGRAIRIISRRLLDAFNPMWMQLPQNQTVQSYIYDIRDPLNYFVYPPSTGGVYVEMNYGLTPAPLVSTAQPIALMDVFGEPIFAYMLFRACAKIAEYAPPPEIASGHYARFLALLSGREKAEAEVNPNAALLPAIPGPAVVGES